jgi:hypothetical protein
MPVLAFESLHVYIGALTYTHTYLSATHTVYLKARHESRSPVSTCRLICGNTCGYVDLQVRYLFLTVHSQIQVPYFGSQIPVGQLFFLIFEFFEFLK